MKSFLTLILSSFVLLASEKPKWIEQKPEGYTHDYFVGVGTSSVSEANARNAALANAMFRVIQNGSISIEGTQTIKSSTTEYFRDGNSVNSSVIDTIINEIKVTGHSTIVKGLSEEEYFTENLSGTITVWSLIKLPKAKPRKDLPPQKSDAIWRSILVPSWGQFFKGDETKGYVIATSLALTIPAGVILGSLKENAEADAHNARTQSLRDYYTEQSNSFNTAQIACYSIAGAVYLYNIVDAIVSPGEKIYVNNDVIRIFPKYSVTPNSSHLGMGIEIRL